MNIVIFCRLSRKNKATAIRESGRFDNIDVAVIISSVSKTVKNLKFTLLMITAEYILSKRPVLRFIVVLLFLLKLFSSPIYCIPNFSDCSRNVLNDNRVMRRIYFCIVIFFLLFVDVKSQWIVTATVRESIENGSQGRCTFEDGSPVCTTEWISVNEINGALETLDERCQYFRKTARQICRQTRGKSRS